jgi:aldehyde dehydrogenase (NAD+)
MVSFTGSTRAGISVTKSAADSVKRVTLELGGKSPNLVFADCGADLEARVRASVAECFLNTGQSCDAPTRLIVESACYDEVVEMARVAAEETEVGDPAPRATISARSSTACSGTACRPGSSAASPRARGWWRAARAGPRASTGAGIARPTVFADVRNDMAIARRRSSARSCRILKAEDEAEAIEIANDTPYGLAAYVQTGDPTAPNASPRGCAPGRCMSTAAGSAGARRSAATRPPATGARAAIMGLEDYQEVKSLHFG